MLRKGVLVAGLALMVSACIGEEDQAEIWPRRGDVIYAAEMHVYCDGSRDLRFVGVMLEVLGPRLAAQGTAGPTLAPGQNKADYLAEGIYVALVTTLSGLAIAIRDALETLENVQGASGNPRIERAATQSLDCV